MKYAVGVMLTTFGIFWAGEGAGVDWPGGDASLIGLLVYVLATSAAARLRCCDAATSDRVDAEPSA